uniref:CRAL/TRIO N-terminal domain-containing protein n=1 Tax=Aegilops tauschii subsp. strangulata TaxID=200361 RepID=A0A453NKG3_AEGTS
LPPKVEFTSSVTYASPSRTEHPQEHSFRQADNHRDRRRAAAHTHKPEAAVQAKAPTGRHQELGATFQSPESLPSIRPPDRARRSLELPGRPLPRRRAMGAAAEDAVRQLGILMDQVDAPLRRTFQNVHQGHPRETMLRFLKAREWNVSKAHKMLVDSLNWRIENEIDSVLERPILPVDLYRSIRDSQLVGLSGYTKEGLPVFGIGVGQSTYDKASV